MHEMRQTASNRENTDNTMIPGLGKIIETPLVSMQIPTYAHLQDIHRHFGKQIGKKYFGRKNADIDCTRAFLSDAHTEKQRKVRTLLFAKSNSTYEPVALIVLRHPKNVISPIIWFTKVVDGDTVHTHEEILETLEAMRAYANQFLAYDYIYCTVPKNDVPLKNVLREMGAHENSYHYVENDAEKTNFLVSFTLTR